MGHIRKIGPYLPGLMAVKADAGNLVDIRNTLAELGTAFQAFRTENDERLAEVQQGFADVVKAEKVDRINAEVSKLQGIIDEVNAKLAAIEMGAGQGERKIKDPTYSSSFTSYFRGGDITADLNKGADAEGGYLTPNEWDRTILDKLVLVSPMRSICRVQAVSKATFTKLLNNHGTSSGWVGEEDARPKTNTSQFSSLSFGHGEMYANPAATQQILDDAEIDIESWLADEVELEFSKQEGTAFITGNGTNKPKGLLTFVTGGANTHPWGAIPEVISGSAAALTGDGIVNLIYDLPSMYTGNARFIMNRGSQGKVRLLKDGQGNYLWQPSYQAGQPATINGYPVTEMPDMPAIAANAYPIAFGDFQRGYQIIDRIGVRILRDPYTNKPYVMFYTTKRVGGGLLNPEVLRVQKVSA